MEIKDLILVVVALLGWTWGIVQFFVNRRYHKKDKLSDRRYEAYNTYMKKYEEIVRNLRKDPSNMIYGISQKFMEKILSGNEDAINQALLEYNQALSEYIKTASEPILIIKQELNALRIVASNALVEKINLLDNLIIDFNSGMVEILEIFKSQNMIAMQDLTNQFSHNERWMQFESLNKDIIDLMRKEIGVQ